MFGTVKLIKNVDLHKYKYFGYDTGFDVNRNFSFSDGCGFGINFVIFGVDISSSLHIDNKEKDILILSKGSTKKLDNTTLTAE